MRRLKTTGLTRFLAVCLAVISLSMLVSGWLGIRAANKERRKDESELQDLRSRIDEYREVSAALMDRVSYEDLNRNLEEKQKKYDTDTARHRADLSTYTAANSGLEMGTAALNQAESALKTGKTQYEMGLKALKSSVGAFNQIASIIEPVQAQRGTIEELLNVAENMLRSEDPYSEDPNGGSVYRLEQAIIHLCDLIENELPGEKDTGQTTDETADGPSAGDTDPAASTPTDEEPPGQSVHTDIDIEDGDQSSDPDKDLEDDNPAGDGQQPGETEKQKPDNTEPHGDLTDDSNPSEGSPRAPGDSEAPLSPKTGEEKDLSGRLNEAIHEVMSAADAVQDDVNTITALAESLNIPPEILQTVLSTAGTSTVDELRNMMIDAIHGSDIVLTPEQGEALEQMLQILASADEMTGSVTDQLKELTDTAEAVDSETNELIRNLSTVLEETDYHFTDEQMRAIRSAYLSNKDSIEAELASVEEERTEAHDTVQRAYSTVDRIFGLLGQLSGARATLDRTMTTMKEMGAQIEEGEAALAEGKAKLDAAKDEQKKKAEELDKKKRELDEQEKALKQSSEMVEEQKELEEREKTLRSALLSREEIRRRSQYGEELLSASERWMTEYAEQTTEHYRDRFDASLLMIVCAVLALAGALTSFGENHCRMVTLLLTLLCLAFSISAAFLLYRMGRGISWSAALTALIAAAELVLLIPSLPVFGHAEEPTGQGSMQMRKTVTKTAGNPDEKKK